MPKTPVVKRQRRPTHPGAILREDVLPALGIDESEFAVRLGVPSEIVGEVINERAGVNVDMAYRLERVVGSSAEMWLRLQQDVDLWDALQAKGDEYAQLERLKVA